MKMIRRTVSHVARNFQVFVVFCVSSAVWCGARFSFRIGPAAFGSGFLDEIGPENLTPESRNEGGLRRGAWTRCTVLLQRKRRGLGSVERGELDAGVSPDRFPSVVSAPHDRRFGPRGRRSSGSSGVQNCGAQKRRGFWGCPRSALALVSPTCSVSMCPMPRTSRPPGCALGGGRENSRSGLGVETRTATL